METPEPVRRWVDEGWSPWRVVYGLAGFVSTVAFVVTYAATAHHPGAVWWLVAAVSVVAAWAISEMVRLRIRLKAAQRPAVSLSPAVNRAVWEARCEEEGEFPDTKALTFGLRQVPVPGSAILDYTALRCTVGEPGGATVESTGTSSWHHYPRDFQGAPGVRPGLYRSRWQGRLQAGEWVDITSGEHEVQPPPKTGLEVVIDREIPTNFPGIGRILEVEYTVTNHDPMEHELFRSMEGSIDGQFYFGPLDRQADPEHQRFIQEAYRIEQRRSGEVPRRVRPHETVHGVYVAKFAWNPRMRLPDYTLVISDGRREFRIRPHGAAESASAKPEPGN